MAQNTSTDGLPTENEQAEHVQQINTVVVDPEDVIKHYTKNLRNKNTLYDARRFRLTGFKSDGVAEVKVGVDPRDEGGYYPDKPHPVWISPGRFLKGTSRDPDDRGQHQDIGVPNERENRRVLRNDSAIEAEEGTEEFEQIVEEGMDEWRDLWETALRKDLKNEIEFVWGASIPEVETTRHTVTVEYETDE